MNELCHLEGGGEEVEATFDLMVFGCSVALDPLEGSSTVLNLLL